MTKLTPQDLSQPEFESWHQTPWFKAYLSEQIEEADEASKHAALGVLVASSEATDQMRIETAMRVGYALALTDLQDLEYSELVEIELEVVSNAGNS